jgi:hypothetical protein
MRCFFPIAVLLAGDGEIAQEHDYRRDVFE